MQSAVEVSRTIPGIPGIYSYDGIASRFTAYFRDSETSIDYAINRYHQPGMGRFLTPDPKRRSAHITTPGSLNRYAYALGDPINHTDRKGLETCRDSTGINDDNADECDDRGDGDDPQAAGANGGSDTGVGGDISDADNQAAITDAFNQVLNLLDNPICAQQVGASSSAAAQAQLENTSINLVPQTAGSFTVGKTITTDPDGVITPGQVYAVETTSTDSTGLTGYSITFNSAINWNDGSATTCVADGSSCQNTFQATASMANQVGASSMTPQQLTQLLLLHELAHTFGQKHDGSSDINNPSEEAYNTRIWEECFSGPLLSPQQ